MTLFSLVLVYLRKRDELGCRVVFIVLASHHCNATILSNGPYSWRANTACFGTGQRLWRACAHRRSSILEQRVFEMRIAFCTKEISSHRACRHAAGISTCDIVIKRVYIYIATCTGQFTPSLITPQLSWLLLNVSFFFIVCVLFRGATTVERYSSLPWGAFRNTWLHFCQKFAGDLFAQACENSIRVTSRYQTI